LNAKAIFEHLTPVILATVIALGGVAAFYFLGLPLPWLLGAILPLLVASRFEGINLAAPKPLIHPARALLGIAIGGSFTPAIVDSLDKYLLSLVFMIPFLFITIVIGKLYYHRVAGFDKTTSIFCALPGGLLEMTLISESHGADVNRVILTHAARVLLIIYGIPFMIQLFTDIDLSGSFVMPGSSAEFSYSEMILVVTAAMAGWWLANCLKLSGASIVGPMIACGCLFIGGWVTFKLPGECINLAQLILGIRLGLSIKEISLREMGENFLYGAGLFFILMVVVLSTAYGVHRLVDMPLIATFLAFVPGGQAEMNIIAIVVGIHIPYIALHHVTRMFLVIGFAPILVKIGTDK